MRTARISALALLAVLAAAIAAPLRAQYDPIFDFIPPGGRSLLTEIFAGGPPAGKIQALLSGERTRDEWVEYLKAHAAALPGVADLDDRQLVTLADYLAYAMPLPAESMPADPAAADWSKVLPADGRDFALNYCQSCHIITVTVTQDRAAEHWLGTMNKPSHVEIELTPEQRQELANYLVTNGGIPIDEVPEDLRAGGASY